MIRVALAAVLLLAACGVKEVTTFPPGVEFHEPEGSPPPERVAVVEATVPEGMALGLGPEDETPAEQVDTLAAYRAGLADALAQFERMVEITGRMMNSGADISQETQDLTQEHHEDTIDSLDDFDDEGGANESPVIPPASSSETVPSSSHRDGRRMPQARIEKGGFGELTPHMEQAERALGLEAFWQLDRVRQDAWVQLCAQALCEGFWRAAEATAEGDWERAAAEVLDSTLVDPPHNPMIAVQIANWLRTGRRE